MDTETFTFTPEQKAKLKEWKSLVPTTEDDIYWDEEAKPVKSIKETIKQTKFESGNNLNKDELDFMFGKMRNIIVNQALTRELYEFNGVVQFNRSLRRLFYGKESLAKRVDQFLRLKGVGIVTMSHFLYAFDPTQYPLYSHQTYDVLQTDSTQEDVALRQALVEHNIIRQEDYLANTLAYLKTMVIFSEIMSLLKLTSYLQVNYILWRAHTESENDEETPPLSTSVRFEKDLTDHLANNPSFIEKGLSLVGKEYRIGDAGIADIVCQDKRGNYVVIETKKGSESDKVVGQILRYIGGLRKEGKKARGIIVVNEPDDKLDFAIEAVKDFIELKYYKVEFKITDIYTGTRLEPSN